METIGKRVEIQTRAWNGDHAAEPGEQPNASLGSRVLLDGKELQGVISAVVDTRNDFSTITIELVAGDFTVRPVDEEEWTSFYGPVATISDSTDRIVAANDSDEH